MNENSVEPFTEDQTTPEHVRLAVLGSHLAGFQNMLKTFDLSGKMAEVHDATTVLAQAFDRLTVAPEATQATLDDVAPADTTQASRNPVSPVQPQ